MSQPIRLPPNMRRGRFSSDTAYTCFLACVCGVHEPKNKGTQLELCEVQGAPNNYWSAAFTLGKQPVWTTAAAYVRHSSRHSGLRGRTAVPSSRNVQEHASLLLQVPYDRDSLILS
ncbi:hypothetical protein Vafri_12119 [Volvox africanus]|uniref:Uncharacterized protein n=1 Tax=Volvox africanus TaxID=51714 RepID=A0A8J4B9G0_9CHLO|nr:hypothetical protein Vafri_12119 [Volvox africanus]